MAVIKIGGASEVEVNEIKDRVTDALNATRAAVEEGVVAGGGTALISASKQLDSLQVANFDQQIGVSIVRKACRLPCKMIAQNAGVEGDVVVGELLKSSDPHFGFDASKATDSASIELQDMFAAGIIDPTLVVRTALQDAASVSALITTSECVIVEEKSDVPAASAAGMGGGMGGMGGMGGGMGGMGGGAGGMPPGMDMAQMMQLVSEGERHVRCCDDSRAARQMQNPAVQQGVQQMMQNPAIMQALMQSNPMVQQMAASNPMLAAALNDPALMQQMLAMQSAAGLGGSMGTGAGVAAGAQMPDLASFVQQMQGAGAGAGAGAAGGGAAAGGVPPNLQQMLASLGAGGMPGAAAAADDGVPAEERFATQLDQLGDMGFTDRDRCIEVLRQVNGNVNAAVERMLGGL